MVARKVDDGEIVAHCGMLLWLDIILYLAKDDQQFFLDVF